MTTTTTNTIIENKKQFSIAKLLLEGRAFLALILIIVVFSLLSPNYFTVENLLIMASQVAIYALLSLGMLMVILNGGIDLSVGSVSGFVGAVAAVLMVSWKVDVVTSVLACLLLLRAPGYGYALLDQLRDLGMSVEANTLYPLLRRLESQGVLVSEWNTEDSRPRRYCRRSPDGDRLAAELLADWKRLHASIEQLGLGDPT